MSHTIKQHTPKSRCERCKKKYRGRGDWNGRAVRGVVVALICPGCQTAEENAEAEINLATTDYSADPFGRIVGTPKVGAR